jgi:hypothetical protein
MTIASLVIGTIISQILFVLTKVIFIHYLAIDLLVIKIAFYVALVLITIAVVRRLGTLNYLESILLCIVWFFTSVLVDMAITSFLIGREMYSHVYFYISYLIILIAIMVFHKALHVEVRKSQLK